MVGHGEKISRKQDHAIAHLLTAPTIAEAARQAGLGEQTVRRWLKDTHFQAAYREARHHAVAQAIAQVQRVASTAVETLQQVMIEPAALASARVSAAKTVLDMAIKAVELEDLARRIAALEQRLGGGTG
jgi:hypothetical protein